MAQDLVIDLAKAAGGSPGTLVVYARQDEPLAGSAAEAWQATGLDWARVSKAGAFAGRLKDVLDIVAPGNSPAERVLVLGAGKPPEGDAVPMTAWTDRGGSLLARLSAAKVARATVLLDGADITPAEVAELAAGLRLRHYRFDRYKSKKRKDDEPAETAMQITLVVADEAVTAAALADRMSTVEGTLLARDLVNEPANVLGTVEFAAAAEALRDLGVSVEVLGQAELEALGMGSLLAVSQGSARPPRLVVMRWEGGPDAEQPLAFVGKGVVFDTGGISIKPAGSMEDMKGDMGGAAAVVGLMKAVALRKAPANVLGVIGLVENMPDGTAIRPGDIVRAMSGTTIEIINTDAEGRLVLADALWYAQERYKPRLVVNLATLTGAIIVALGHEYAGLYSNNDELAGKLLDAGQRSGEKLWRMPLAPAYDKLIESRFADIKNTGGRAAGSVTAAQFLQRFIQPDTAWAHLDIAGTAFGVNANEINTSWATGFGVALLDRLVRDGEA